MCKSKTNRSGRISRETAGKGIEIVPVRPKGLGNFVRRFVIALLVLAGSAGTLCAIANEYSTRVKTLAEEIVLAAEELRDATAGPASNSIEVDEILGELKGLIREYEEVKVFAESPYPGEIMLGSTPPGDDGWLETLCSTRYDGPIKEIRIRRTGHRANYLRINDIEITYVTPAGLGREIFNQNARVKLYYGGVFKLALPKPMRVTRVRIKINHESTGLEVSGVPYITMSVHRPAVRNGGVREVLLGTTPGGDDNWLETLCSSRFNMPVRYILLKRTGTKTPYLRINDIEVTHLTREGLRKEVFNESGRVKLYRDGQYKLPLPRPMRVTHIRVLVHHESTGLEVYGVY